MISAAVRLTYDDLIMMQNDLERVEVTCDADGHPQAIRWRYATRDSGLHGMVKRMGGAWNPAAGGWTFNDGVRAQEMLDAIIKRHPDWPIIGHPDKPFLPLAGVSISRLRLADGLDACLMPAQLHPFTKVIFGGARGFRLADGKREVGLLLGSAAAIDIAVQALVAQGAICNAALAKKWRVIRATGNKLQVKVTGWAMQITCDLSNPLHYAIAPPQQYRWDAPYPYGSKVAVPWKGTICTTRKHWPTLKSSILEAGLAVEGDDPDAEISAATQLDVSRIAGWDNPAPNGATLHEYQKKGADFCAARGMRALLGDEMGVGKTAQAIAAVEGCSVPRVVVVCPANARYVWDREIQGWGGRGAIQHITSQIDKLDMSARWHIVTYDLLASRTETWRFCDDAERQVFIDAFPDLAAEIQDKGITSQITLQKPLDKLPAFAAKRVAAWERIMRRLRGELLDQILAAGPLLTILDEAHRVKNKSAKRTKAIQRLAAVVPQVLMLTGTPLRNNEHEAAVLLSLLDADAAAALDKTHGYTVEDVKDYLNYFMLRRTKAQVLPELPEKTRQRIDIDNLDAEQMWMYTEALTWAMEMYDKALSSGKSEGEARQEMQGGIEKARKALGAAKVLGGEVAALVVDVVENKECCVVFCAHHTASDVLKAQLASEGLRVAVVDGRTQGKDRAALVAEFQEARLDVIIGGINAAGEAITLHRADTVIFVELDWVPAALLQAEDRIHRVGQRRNCQVIQLVARMHPGVDNLDEIMVDLIGAKMTRIGTILDEDTTNIISGSIQAQLHNRLLAGTTNASSTELVTPASSEAPSHRNTEPFPDSSTQEAIQAVPTSPIKRRRGRPKVYTENKRPPTATERSKQSIKALIDQGGKRVMLRLSSEAHEALKVVVAVAGVTQTAAINQSIIARKNELLQTSTKITQSR